MVYAFVLWFELCVEGNVCSFGNCGFTQYVLYVLLCRHFGVSNCMSSHCPIEVESRGASLF